MAMDKLAGLIDAARTLSPDDRRRLIGELDALDRQPAASANAQNDPLAALLAVSGAAHSNHRDISTNKYAHVGVAVDPER